MAAPVPGGQVVINSHPTPLSEIPYHQTTDARETDRQTGRGLTVTPAHARAHTHRRKQDLAEILSTSSLLSGLVHAPSTAHPSTLASTEALSASLADNVDLASHLAELEGRVARGRAAAQALLLSTHALERQWRARQSEMDRALGPFAPASLYQRLGGALAEQEGVCGALEESFLEGEGEGGQATEREALDWVRRYREARRGYYLRRERKERWDEGRVGGWR